MKLPCEKATTYYKTIIDQRNTGSYSFTLDKEYTGTLLFVGNGGGGNSSQKDSQWWSASGGSGACFEGVVRLPAGTYTFVLGTLGYGSNVNNTHFNSGGLNSTNSYLQDSNGNVLITVGCGAKGNTNYTSTTGGVGGTLTLGTLDVVDTIIARNGNQTVGNSGAGSLSAYDNTYTGYGAGTCGTYGAGTVYAIAGIAKLTLITDKNNFDYFINSGDFKVIKQTENNVDVYKGVNK